MAANTKYAYSARDVSGNIKSGVITAANETAVTRRLNGLGLAPISVRKADESVTRGRFGVKKRVKAKHLALFSRQFAVMLNSGMPMMRTLTALQEQIEHPEFQRVIPLIQADVEAGTSLSTAMGRHKTFPPLMIGMIAAGESSGSLPATLFRVADNFDKEAKLRSKVVSAMTYPIIVLGMAVVMVTGMLLFIVPSFAKTFADLGGELPLPTQLLVAASTLVRYAFLPILAGVVAGTWWWRKHKNDEAVRNRLDPILLKIPIMGTFRKKIVLARFARTFSALMTSGVPMLQAIDLTSSSSGNAVLTKALNNVKDAVRSGRTLASPLASEPIFPNIVAQMVATGEETGDLPNMLDKIADYFDMEVDATADALSSILEPLLMVVLAAIIGSMVVAMYLPMFSIYDLIG